MDSVQYFTVGIVLGLYRITGFATFFIGLSAILNYSDKEVSSYRKED